MWIFLENSGIKWKNILTFVATDSYTVMVKFIGEYSCKIDDKGRVIFPSAFKGLMDSGDDMRLVVKKDIFADCLEMFTFQEWERQSDKLKSKLNFFNEQHAAFWRQYMRDCAVVEPDSKPGRITIPKKLLESIGAGKEIVFAGNDHKIEIWAREKFEASGIPKDDYISIARSLANL